MSRAAVLLLLLLTFACASAHVGGYALGPPTALEPREVVARARTAFRALSIPVEEYDPAHLISSGVFRVRGWWAGEAVSDRIDCGSDEQGKPLAADGPVDVEIQVIADDRGLPRHPRTYVEIQGGGTLRAPDRADAGPCDLTAAFRDRLRRSVVDDPPPVRPGGFWGTGGILRILGVGNHEHLAHVDAGGA